MKRVLVTGSEGSLMQSVIPKLIAKGHSVSGVDNLVRYGKRPGHAQGYTFYKGDLTDYFYVQDLLDSIKPHYVIQAAARIYGVGGFNSHCADILGNDVALHSNILKASVESKVQRVVYISSSMVYETCYQGLDEAVSEFQPDTSIVPYTDYGLSKLVGERLSKSYQRQYGLDYTIWRPFNIITPYEKVTTEEIGVSHVFADFIKNIVEKKMNPLPIIGNGEQIRCFTWIDEVASAIADYSFRDSTKNDIYNLGNPEPISMKELANLIYKVAVEMKVLPEGKLNFETVADYPDDVRVRLPDVTKAKNLGWEAKQKVEESIRECLAHFA